MKEELELSWKSWYNACIDSGMFWEWFPELQGNFLKDKEQFMILLKNKWPNFPEYPED